MIIVYQANIRPSRSGCAGAGIRMALFPLTDTNTYAVGPKMPFRVVYCEDIRYGGEPWITSCRGLNGGARADYRGHRKFNSTAEAIAWLMGDDKAGHEI